MPNPTTHEAVMKELMQEKPDLFRDINIKYFLSGSVFPDIGYFISSKNKKQLSIYLHSGVNSTLNFARYLLKIAKTKKEKSFALGFMSHAIIDDRVHKELTKLEMYGLDHISAEYFLDTKFKEEKTIVYCKIPNKIIKQTLIKEKRKDLIKSSQFNIVDKIIYKLSQSIIKRFILNRYISKKKIKKSYIIDTLVRKTFKKPLFEFETDIQKILNPNYSIKRKSLKILLKACEKGKKDFVKILKTNS
jgi:hypothetical protein